MLKTTVKANCEEPEKTEMTKHAQPSLTAKPINKKQKEKNKTELKNALPYQNGSREVNV